MRSETIAGAAALLAEAHHTGQRLNRLPADCRPTNIAEAYAIQDAMVHALGPIGGWKVGRSGNDEPRCAPMPKHRLFQSGVALHAASYPDAALEIEFAFRIRAALPARADRYDRGEVAAAVDLVPLIEIVGTRFFDLDAVDPLEKLADLSANAAFVVGRPVADWRRIELPQTDVKLSINGTIVQKTTGPGPAGDPLALLVWMANHAMARSGGLKPDEMVTTGALRGMTPIAAGSHAAGKWQDWGHVELSFAAA
jgi:2-keto-4-pentenoate hydratase